MHLSVGHARVCESIAKNTYWFAELEPCGVDGWCSSELTEKTNPLTCSDLHIIRKLQDLRRHA